MGARKSGALSQKECQYFKITVAKRDTVTTLMHLQKTHTELLISTANILTNSKGACPQIRKS